MDPTCRLYTTITKLQPIVHPEYGPRIVNIEGSSYDDSALKFVQWGLHPLIFNARLPRNKVGLKNHQYGFEVS